MNNRDLYEICVSVRRELLSRRDSNYSLFGFCAIASYKIFNILKDREYSPVFCCSFNHCFIEFEGYIIDITATQFDLGCPPVIIEKSVDFYKKYGKNGWWYNPVRCSDKNKIAIALSKWPKHQVPEL